MTGSCSTSLFKAEGDEKPGIKAKTRSAKALIRMGDATWRRGNTAAAARFYQAAANAAPNDPVPTYKLARALQAMGAHVAAADSYRKVLLLRPGNADAKRQIANTLISLDKPQEAIVLYQEVIAAGGDYRAFNGLGVALDMTGKHKDALAAYRAGLAKEPESLTLKNNLALSMALAGQYTSAARVLRTVTAHPQATARHRQNLALVYGLAGQDHQAAQMARADLDTPSVSRNLAYYTWLRRQPRWMVKKMLHKGAPVKPQQAKAGTHRSTVAPARKENATAPRRSRVQPPRRQAAPVAQNIALRQPESEPLVQFARLEFGFRPVRDANGPAAPKPPVAKRQAAEPRVEPPMPVVVRGAPKPAQPVQPAKSGGSSKSAPLAKPAIEAKTAPAIPARSAPKVVRVANPKVIKVAAIKVPNPAPEPAPKAAPKVEAAAAPVAVAPSAQGAKVIQASVARTADAVTRRVELHFIRTGLEHLMGSSKPPQTASN